MHEDTIYNFRKELETLGYCKGIVRSYPRHIKHFLLFTGEIPTKITTEHIKNYHDYLRQRPNKMRKGDVPNLSNGLSESSILRELRAIKIYFNYLQRTAQIKSNPFTLKIKKPVYKARTVLTPQEIQSLYGHCHTQQETILLHLAYGCGLRRSEMENLNIGDVNLEKRLLYVREGKGKKRRVVPLTEKITGGLKSYLESRKRLRKVGEVAFLLNTQGNRLLANRIYDLFKTLSKKAQTPSHISVHHLRHSIATHLLENNMSIEMVRDFLGHNQLSTTQIYTRVNLFRDEQRKT